MEAASVFVIQHGGRRMKKGFLQFISFQGILLGDIILEPQSQLVQKMDVLVISNHFLL